MINVLITTLLLLPSLEELGKTIGVAAFICAAAFGGIAGTVRWYRKDKTRRVTEIAAQETITQGRIDRAVITVIDEHDKRLELYKGNAEALDARLRIIESEKQVLQKRCDDISKLIQEASSDLREAQRKTLEVVDLNLGLQGQLTEAQRLIRSNGERITELEKQKASR